MRRRTDDDNDDNDIDVNALKTDEGSLGGGRSTDTHTKPEIHVLHILGNRSWTGARSAIHEEDEWPRSFIVQSWRRPKKRWCRVGKDNRKTMNMQMHLMCAWHSCSGYRITKLQKESKRGLICPLDDWWFGVSFSCCWRYSPTGKKNLLSVMWVFLTTAISITYNN